MAVPHSVPTLLGGLAVFTTLALLAVHALLVYELAHRASSPAYTAALAAIALEGVAVLILTAHLASHVRRSRKNHSSEKPPLRQFLAGHGPWLLSSSLICTAAAVVSVVALVRLAKAPSTVPYAILGPDVVPFLCGASVTLGICYLAQLLFLASLVALRGSVNSSSSSSSAQQQPMSLENGHGKSSRSVSDGSSGSGGSSTTKVSPSFSSRVKAIPYSKTASPKSSRRMERTRPPSSKKEARAGLVSSLRLPLPRVVRPVTSKTHLLSPTHSTKGFLASALRGSGGGGGSTVATLPSSGDNIDPADDTATAHELATRPSSFVEDFDSWDTSAVDPQSRRTVLAGGFRSTSSLASTASSQLTVVAAAGASSRFLETIPASPSPSPAVSRSPSPGNALDLPRLQPKNHQRRRSDSPASSARLPAAYSTRMRAKSQSSQSMPRPITIFPPPPLPAGLALLPPPSPSEAHIHPLFRSDSPNPAPSVSSANTVVTAAPNGGQVLTAAEMSAPALRSLQRMRSGSLPVSKSPLSRQSSFDVLPGGGGSGSRAGSSRGGSRGGSSSHGKKESVDSSTDLNEDVEDEDEEDDDATRRRRADSGAERKMTPPIPEWILSAGARRSLSGYQSRRERA